MNCDPDSWYTGDAPVTQFIASVSLLVAGLGLAGRIGVGCCCFLLWLLLRLMLFVFVVICPAGNGSVDTVLSVLVA